MKRGVNQSGLTRRGKKMAKSKISTQKAHEYKVKVTKDGPYLVSGGTPLSEQAILVDSEGESHGWKERKKYSTQDNYVSASF